MIHLDFETRSRTDLKKLGGYRYAEDPSTEVLVLAVQQHGTDHVLSWDVRGPVEGNAAIGLLRKAIDEGRAIWAFNAPFEWVILKYVCPRQFGFPVPDINTMRCTAAVCRSAGMPPSLEKSAEFLKLPVRKDKIGYSLIQRFSVPDKKTGDFNDHTTHGEFSLGGKRTTYAEAFQRFVDYCEQDVRTELAVGEAMKPYHLKGFPLAWFQLDMRINDRGVPVDVKALKAAQRWVKEHETKLASEFREITGLNHTQRDRVLEWFQSEGYRFDSIAVRFREQALRGSLLSDKARRALTLKGELSYAAVKKVPSMISMVMTDGRIRGSFMWCGAQKTWRWTSKAPQWQNMKKPPKWLRPVIEDAYQAMRNGTVSLEDFEFLYGPPYEVIASMSRYFVRFPDRNVLDLDFSSVEARILPFLIGADRIIHKIKTGGDIYTSTGTALEAELRQKHRVPFDIDRDTAKTIVLATQFQGGWHAVFTATGEKWNREWCETAVKIVRRENPELKTAWGSFQDAFVDALDNPNRWVKASPMVSFGFFPDPPFPRLMMRLASGRCITMPYPEKAPITMVKFVEHEPKTKKPIKTRWERRSGHTELPAAATTPEGFSGKNTLIDTHFHTWELSFYGHIKGTTYGRVPTYGGNDLQSATQGAGADLLAYGAIKAEQAGFDPFFIVHDQCLTPDDGRREEFERVMCSIPKWFEGFPLEADAESVRSYQKS